jgi:hypothetical protein
MAAYVRGKLVVFEDGVIDMFAVGQKTCIVRTNGTISVNGAVGADDTTYKHRLGEFTGCYYSEVFCAVYVVSEDYVVKFDLV